MKPAIQPSDSTGLSALFQLPPRISLSSSVLVSAIDLLPNPLISCSVFIATHATTPSEQLAVVEAARRRILLDNASSLIADSLLPSVYATKEHVSLYVFALGSTVEASPSQKSLSTLQLDALERSETYQFTPDSIYPCSASCSAQLLPCAICLQQADTSATPSTSSQATSSLQSSPASILPRRPLRLPFSQFLQAVRHRLISDAALAAASLGKRPVLRLQDGFLLHSPSADAHGEWGTGWDHYARLRPYLHCHMQVDLTRTQLRIHPVLRSTPYFPLSSCLPLQPRTPIVLIPHGVPAYFLNIYSGAVGSLTRQFEEALVGLGCENWKASPSHKPQDSQANDSTVNPSYLIAWISVQNKQGEEKGLPVIWPTALAVVPDSSCQSRPPLEHIPDLPPQLLASPPAVPAQAPPIKLPLSSLNPPASASAAPSPAYALGRTSPSPSVIPEKEHHMRLSRPSVHRSPTSDSLRAFRSLTISRKDIHGVARDISTYVASVAQERERERERIRREREGSSSRIASSPLKPEADSPAQPSPAVTAKPELEVQSVVTQQPTPSDMDKPMQVDVHGSTSIQKPGSVEVGALLPPVDIAPPADIASTQTAPEVADILPETSGLPAGTGVLPDTSVAPFDNFAGFDSTWNQTGSDFLNMGMSLDNYSFAMGMDLTGANDAETTNDDEFGLFTDDDFNFFDAPSSAVRTTAPAIPSTSPTAASRTFAGMQTSGPGPPPYLTNEHHAPWSTQFALDSLTPRSMPASTPGFPPPELVPSTPVQSPPSHSGPTTPAVTLLDHAVHVRRSSMSSQGSNVFEPIHFAPNHKATDQKYVHGKFALPTPPPEDVERIWPLRRRSQDSSAPADWKFFYGSVTDPRIGIVRRLVGAKRKRLGEDESDRPGRISPAWLREHEEWASSSPPAHDDADVDSRSDSDVDMDDDEADAEARSVLSPSRSYTPPPLHLPLGPSLVQTSFHHSHLLPLSMALRPPGAAAAQGTGAASVPTPVSPAAALGASSERAKMLEAVAQFLVKEMVENPVWAEAWGANVAASRGTPTSISDVWPVDVRYASRLFNVAEQIRSSTELKAIFASDISDVPLVLKELDQPSISVVKSEALIQVLPTALRFWEKLGLRPRVGSKDVTAFVFFEGISDAKETEVADWLDRVSQAYSAKNYGSHTPGRAAGCTRDGLVPVQFDSIRKTLASFVTTLPDFASSMVFYIVTPLHAIHLTSPTLRHIFSAMRKARKAATEAAIDFEPAIVFHLVPESLLSGNLDNPVMRHLGLEAIVDAVYDRIPIRTRRMMSRKLGPDGAREQALFLEPAFALARPLAKKPTYRLEAHPSSLDVMDRSSILHIGYCLSPCGRWLLAACIDQRGEMHELKTWLVKGDGAEGFAVNNVWAFAVNIAARANVEWRIVITKLGHMNETEIEAWGVRLSGFTHDLPPCQIFLMVADPSRPWAFIVPEHTTPKSLKSPNRVHKHSTGTILHDVSATTYLVQADVSSTVALDPPQSLLPAHAFIPDTEEANGAHSCIVRPLASAALLRVPAGTDFTSVSMIHLHLLHTVRDSSGTSPPATERQVLEEIAQNYHDLALLAKLRWKLQANPILPFHLAALEVMGAALACDESLTD